MEFERVICSFKTHLKNSWSKAFVTILNMKYWIYSRVRMLKYQRFYDIRLQREIIGIRKLENDSSICFLVVTKNRRNWVKLFQIRGENFYILSITHSVGSRPFWCNLNCRTLFRIILSGFTVLPWNKIGSVNKLWTSLRTLLQKTRWVSCILCTIDGLVRVTTRLVSLYRFGSCRICPHFEPFTAILLSSILIIDTNYIKNKHYYCLDIYEENWRNYT